MAGKKKNTAPEAENEDLSRGVRSLAIIPDGNRRWARKRGLPAIAGHSRGARVLKDISRMCCDRGIRFLTFYAFSTENWKRSEQEVGALIGLLKSLLDDYERELGGDKGLDWACARPAGTEPKLKIYFGVYDADEKTASDRLESIKSEMSAFVENKLG